MPGIHAVRALLLCVTFAVFCLGVRPAAAHDLEAGLDRLMAEHDTIGLAVVVVRDDAIVYSRSLGWRDRDREIALEQGDLFRIASISKSFATTAVLQLVEQGRLSLDDDVSGLIGFRVRNPAFPDRPITLGMLLAHTSSIVDGPDYGNLDVIDPGAGQAWRASYAERAPGEGYAYSNLGYNMVGTIVERASGQRFDAYVKSRILEPLGLEGGYVPETLDSNRFAQIYRHAEGAGFTRSDRAYARLGARLDSYAMGRSTPMLSPTGGLKISAQDLARYMRMHINDGQLEDVRILPPEQARAMRRPVVEVDEHADYGLGLRIDRNLVPGIELTGHTGSAYGLYSSMFFDADRGHGIVVITNGTRDVEVRTAVNRLLYDRFLSGSQARGRAGE